MLFIRILIVIGLFSLAVWLMGPTRLYLQKNAQQQDWKAHLINQELTYQRLLVELGNRPKETRLRLDCLEHLAAIYMQEHQFKKAEALYKKSWIERSEQNLDYDAKLVLDMILLANLYLNNGNFEQAESCYKQAWDYDKSRLDRFDPPIARDLNNLGVFYYMKAQTLHDALERQLCLARANFFLIQSRLCLRGEKAYDHQDEANTMENQSIVMRDTGNIKEAELLKKEAQQLHSRVKWRLQLP